NAMLDAWLRSNADGTVTVFTGKVELGQGIKTALAQIAAEELDVPLARVTMVTADTGRTPNEGQTAGSQSVENSGTALRMAGAEVRAILLDLAAKKFGVGADALTVSDGVISAPDGRKVGYGELAGEANLKREATAKVAAQRRARSSRSRRVPRSPPRPSGHRGRNCPIRRTSTSSSSRCRARSRSSPKRRRRCRTVPRRSRPPTIGPTRRMPRSAPPAR